MTAFLQQTGLVGGVGVFIVAALVIGFAGTSLARIADVLADRTGMGQVLAGALFVGISTSLPGIITSMQTAWQGHAQLAIGNALGGLTVQTLFLVAADMAYRRINLEHAAASVTGLAQATLLVSMLVLPLLAFAGPNLTLGHVHPASILMFLLYGFGLTLLAEIRSQPMWAPVQTDETRDDGEEAQVDVSAGGTDADAGDARHERDGRAGERDDRDPSDGVPPDEAEDAPDGHESGAAPHRTRVVQTSQRIGRRDRTSALLVGADASSQVDSGDRRTPDDAASESSPDTDESGGAADSQDDGADPAREPGRGIGLDADGNRRPTSLLWIAFLVLAAVTAAAGYTVAITSSVLVEMTGVSETAFGTLFTAIANSLPELVTAVAAVRIGAVNLAVGDILGGNAFDVLFLSAADLVYLDGSIYDAFTRTNLFTMGTAILMTGILLLGLLNRQRSGVGNIGWESVAVVSLYLLSTVVLFL